MDKKPADEELELLVQKLEVEQELREAREFSESLLNTAQVIILVLDTNGLVVYFNPYMEKISGCRLEDVKGMDWFSTFLPEQDYDRIRELFQKAVSDIQTSGNINSIVTKDGRERFIEWSDKTLRNATGEVIGLLAIGQDITERHQAEEALKKSELYLSTLLESTPAGIILINAETHEIADINNSAARMIGASREELFGKKCHEYICPAGEGQCPITDFGQTVDQSERILIKNSGKLVPIFKTVVPITLDGHKYLLESFYDITDRKRAEENEKSLKEKEILLQEIHHRAKNNMQIISSLLNLQSQYVKDEESLKIFKESKDRILSMASIHEKLYQSKDMTNIDFNGYIINITERLFHAYVIDPNDVRLSVKCSDVFLDIHKAVPCGLIINELISNAFKHAFPQGREGNITVDFHPDGDNRLILTVSDDGVGLPEDMDTSDTETLGLRLVGILVSQLKGTMEIERKGGTRFSIAFLP